jgi:hypothetical protein
MTSTGRSPCRAGGCQPEPQTQGVQTHRLAVISHRDRTHCTAKECVWYEGLLARSCCAEVALHAHFDADA